MDVYFRSVPFLSVPSVPESPVEPFDLDWRRGGEGRGEGKGSKGVGEHKRKKERMIRVNEWNDEHDVGCGLMGCVAWGRFFTTYDMCWRKAVRNIWFILVKASERAQDRQTFILQLQRSLLVCYGT